MKKLILTGVIGLLMLMGCGMTTAHAEKSAQQITNEKIYNQVYEQVRDYRDSAMNVLVIAIAKQFLGTEYVASTLEIEPEALQIFLDKTDCILFVELCSAFALTVKGDSIVQNSKMSSLPSVLAAQPSYELLCHNIQQMRYRKGVIDGYASRVHYTSEWIIQNHNNGLMNEITADLGGEEYEQKFFFMSQHAEIYKQLQNNAEQTKRVKDFEQFLESQKPYYNLSQKMLKKPEVIAKIQSGDIINFKDKKEGVDIAHVALAYEHDGQMHFIHASSKAKKVIIEPQTLADYAVRGIRVVRFNKTL